MAESIRKVNVIGHLNPDTDSICSAISYAYLKTRWVLKSLSPAAAATSIVRLHSC